MSERLNEIKQHLEGTTTSPLFLLDACHSLVEEVERLGNVKMLLMELGNRLVIEHGWEPAAGTPALMSTAMNSTAMIRALTIQINSRPDMREALVALGYEWPMMEAD